MCKLLEKWGLCCYHQQMVHARNLWGLKKKTRGQLKVSQSRGNFWHNWTKINMKWSLMTDFGFKTSLRGLSAFEICRGEGEAPAEPQWQRMVLMKSSQCGTALAQTLGQGIISLPVVSLQMMQRNRRKKMQFLYTGAWSWRNWIPVALGYPQHEWEWGENVIFPRCLQNEIPKPTK